MEIKINVRDIFTGSYINSWPKDTELFLFLIDISHSRGGITSPDLQNTGSGLARVPKRKNMGLDLYKAINNKSIRLKDIGKRKGYKTYTFTFQ